MAKLSIRAFTVAGGLFWGVAMFLLTWWLIARHGSSIDAGFLGRVYPGYTVTPAGSVIGLAWGLIDGAVSSAIFAALYNCALTWCPLCKCQPSQTQ